VVRYNRYFEDLKALKVACKRYQTQALLEQEFPALDVWAAMGEDDKTDVAAGRINAGQTAWSLVKRFLDLQGNGDRTLKNYGKALKTAGLN
jgi:hypothetical protein